MNSIRTLPSLALIAVLASLPPAAAAQTNVGFNPTADFSRYRTYAWNADTTGAGQAWNAQIREAVNRELTDKGLTRAESNPDLVVNAFASTEDTVKVEINPLGYTVGNWEWVGVGMNAKVMATTTYRQGTVVVDLVDAGTKELAWRGAVTSKLSGDTDSDGKKFDAAVGKMFKQYPPKTKTAKAE